MIRKICILLACILTFSSLIYADSEDVLSTDSMKNAPSYELLDALNIDIPESVLKGDKIKRSDFVYVVMQPFGINSSDNAALPYSDVSSNAPYVSSLKAGLDMGALSESDMFYPDEYITVNQAYKIMLVLLGKTYMANAKGGYPHGFSAVADETELSDGVIATGDEALTSSDFKILTENFFLCEVSEISSVSNGDFKLTDGKTLIECCYNVYMKEAVITADTKTALYNPAYNTSKGFVELDGELFKCDFDVRVGCCVKAFIKEGQNVDTLLMIDYSENDILVIDTDDVSAVSGNVLEYESEDKIRKIRTESDAAFLYNGKASPKRTLNDVSGIDGIIELTDNDLNGAYDVVNFYNEQIMQVLSVNTFDKTISDSISGFLKLEEDSDSLYSILKGGKSIGLNDIKSGDIISYYVSEDSSFTLLDISGDTLTGIVTSTDTENNKIFVDGNEYQYDEYFEKNYIAKIAFGEEMTFSLSTRGKISAIKSGVGSDMSYGYFIAMSKPNGLDNEYKVKILSQSGKTEIFTIAESIRLNGEKVKREDAATELTEKQVIRYSASLDKVITKIDTPANTSGYLDGSEEDDNKLIKYQFPNQTSSTLTYYRASSGFAPYFAVGDSTVIFSVNQSPTVAEDKRYNVLTKNYLALNQHFLKELVEAYDVTITGDTGVIVIYHDYEKENAVSNTNYYESALLKSVTRAITPDGSDGLKLVLCRNKEYEDFYVTDESVLKNKTISENAGFDSPMINPGDYFRISYDSDNVLTYLERDFNVADKLVQKNAGSYTSSCAYFFGKVYAVSGSSVSIVPENWKGLNTDIDSNPNLFAWQISGPLPVYDSETGDVTYTTVEDIISYRTAADECVNLLVKTNNTVVVDAVIYR